MMKDKSQNPLWMSGTRREQLARRQQSTEKELVRTVELWVMLRRIVLKDQELLVLSKLYKLLLLKFLL